MNQQYPIDKIIVMTLERSMERYLPWRGAAAIMQIPPDIVYYAYGEDNLTYGNSMQAAAEAATKDGFPFVAEYADSIPKEKERPGIQQTCATVCQIWNYCWILRWLIENNETALIIFDDKMLTIEFAEFCRLVNEVTTIQDEEFYALQLLLRGHPSELQLPEISDEQRIRNSFETFRGIFGGNTGSYKETFLQKGLFGYDETIVWSPAGAAWVLKCLDLAPGFYYYFDHFLCEAMPDYAKAQIERNKGVYCPSEIGYKFADVYMELGTTTDYAVQGSPLYKVSTAKTDIQLLPGRSGSVKKEKASQSPATNLQQRLERIVK